MNNFTYYAPTKVVLGKDTENQVGELINDYGAKKVLLHYGGESARKSGLLERVENSLKKAGISVVSLGGVVPNPRLSLIYKGIELCKSEGVDFILAVGGGSVIDSSKAIGYGAANNFDVWDIYDWKAKPTACLPIGAVLTLAAAGSEMSDSSVITKDEGMIKRGTKSPLCRCKFAVLNPELTYTLPAFQTACGITDIIMHTLERFFSKGETMEMSDGIAVSLIKTVMKNGQIVMKNPRDYNARAEIMWAGSLSHNGLTGCGAEGDWATHQLEHELSGMFDVAHGAGLAAVWGAWARYVLNENQDRFNTFAKMVFDIDGKDAGLKSIRVMEDYFKGLSMPVTISELLGAPATKEQISEMTEKCAHHDRTIGGLKVLNKADIKRIYEEAL